MKFRIEKAEKGSISIEAAVLMPVFLGVILVFISILQIMSAEQILCSATVKTADKMCKWAPIYKNIAVDNIQEGLISQVGGKLKEELQGEAGEFLMGILQLKKASENALDYVYGFTSQTLCEKYIREDIFVKKGIVNMQNLNLYKSDFFYRDSNSISIKAICSVKTYLPFDVKIASDIECVAWGKGVMPHISSENSTDSESETQCIWEKDNLYRGKVIRQMYGANLPAGFPAIDIFENGMATMIKSMNHTAESYKNTSTFEYKIKSMIDELYAFRGASFAGISITQKDMLQKRLVLVMPENEFSVLQSKAIENLMRYAASKLIVLDLQRYQKI